MKAQKEWVDFKIENITDREEFNFNQKSFEERLKDTFEAVELDENGKPLIIWTSNYVITIVSLRIMWGDTAWTIAPRNPVYL